MFDAEKVVPPSMLKFVPPVALIVMVPSVKPKQLASAVLTELITTSSTVTEAVIGLPVQVAVLGVIVYVTVPVGGVVVVSVCAMVAPLAAEAPVTLVELSIQLNVVPATLDVNAMFVAVPLQMVDEAGVAVTSGTAFTVTLVVCVSPQEPGMVYVIVFTPTAAVAGSNTPVAATIHEPHVALQVPPPSTAVIATVPLSWQNGPAGVMVASNYGFIVTVTVVVFTQLLTSVPVIVYVVVAAGVDVTVAPVVALRSVPGDQVYVEAPLAVNEVL